MYGDMFQYRALNGLYLSASNAYTPSLTTLNLYSNIKSISGRYPPITVLPVEKYDIVENYIVQFKLPENLLAGNYDIVYFNDAGYFKASDTKNFTYFEVKSTTYTISPTAFVSFNVEFFIDNDDDGYSNLTEQSFGTNPNDPNDFPISLFNVFNNI